MTRQIEAIERKAKLTKGLDGNPDKAKDAELLATLQGFRNDERRHRDDARAHLEPSIESSLIGRALRLGVRAAIETARRV